MLRPLSVAERLPKLAASIAAQGTAPGACQLFSQLTLVAVCRSESEVGVIDSKRSPSRSFLIDRQLPSDTICPRVAVDAWSSDRCLDG